MAYTKQGFADNVTVLTAAMLGKMEDGIIEADSGIRHIVSGIDGKEVANLRDLESGTYSLYGYFAPYQGSQETLQCTELVHVAHLSAGSHIMCISPLNAKLTFIEILVDDSAPGGHTYTAQQYSMPTLYGLIERVEALEAAQANTN